MLIPPREICLKVQHDAVPRMKAAAQAAGIRLPAYLPVSGKGPFLHRVNHALRDDLVSSMTSSFPAVLARSDGISIDAGQEIGGASCRERVCQSGEISGVA